MSHQRVAMLRLAAGARADTALAELATALPAAETSMPDELGVFEIALDAPDQEAALQQVWDAVAATGADEHVVFLEHADMPEHWRARARRPGET